MIPYPDEIPRPLRALGRKLLPPGTRIAGGQFLQWAAQYQTFFSSDYRANSASISSFRDKYKGQTCIIMGNGPSLAQIDPDLLRRTPTFGLNRGYLLWRKWDFTPSFFVAVNDLVIEQFHREIALLDCPKFLPWRYRTLFENGTNQLFVPQSWRPGFGVRPEKGLWSGGTVTFTAMQLAFFMGFAKVVLVGVDHHFDYEGDHNEEVVSKGPDRNHFDATYFGKGISWNLPDLPLSEKAYLMAREAFEADKREIVNATAGGALEIFRRQGLVQALAK